MVLKKRCDAVFEGGGVRGIGLVGAVYQMERSGYTFGNVAGSSAGAIIASLLAAGYTGEEIYEEMKRVNYFKFKEKHLLDYFGIVGKLLSILFHFGIYSADYFEQWLTELLSRKGVYTFGDLKCGSHTGHCKYKLQVTASDITDEELLVFPRDFHKFGIMADMYPIAKAVRMSMSIPVFYEPFILRDQSGKKHYIADGGMLSNYPMWLLDEGTTEPQYPTIGFKFCEQKECSTLCKCNRMNIVEYMGQLVSTMMDVYDKGYIAHSQGDLQRSIQIPVHITVNGTDQKIRTTDFAITSEESQALFQNGVNAATEFLQRWDFHEWKQKYRLSEKNKTDR